MWGEDIFRGRSLCVVGNINRDVKTTPLHAGSHLFADGETSVGAIVETIGGGGANSAFAAASLGAKVSFLGKAGDDPLGRRLERTLLRHGIGAHLTKDPRLASGTSIALAFDNGHRHFLCCLPASEALGFADLDLTALQGHAHLLRADVWFSESMLWEGNRRLFESARGAGIAVSVDINWDPQWSGGDAGRIAARKQALREVLPLVDLAHGNARELMTFADAPDLDVALRRVVEWGAGAVVVHLGRQGGGYYSQGALVVEPPAPVARQINTTGTGDAFSVAMMLLHQRPDISIQERLRIANGIVAEFMDGRRPLIPPLAE